ncbi:MAG: NUDIX hydrolase [Candidatus Ancillula sp.]|jgi:8-oxo-dGTP pyrophosphatase MutT (NUDIX family)|nr:NUDIX hydrolase [Candidatus Ancillula sp.]
MKYDKKIEEGSEVYMPAIHTRLRFGQLVEEENFPRVQIYQETGTILVAPYVQTKNQIWIYAVHESRFTLHNSETINLPQGFIEKGENPLQAAKREIREEMGIEIVEDQLFLLAQNLVPDVSFYDYREVTPEKPPYGNNFFGLDVSDYIIKQSESEINNNTQPQIDSQYYKGLKLDETETISGGEFFPLETILQNPQTPSVAGAALLFYKLKNQ